MDQDWDWSKLIAPGPGVWKREREHRRAPRDHISEYVGSPEHQMSPVLRERFAGGDVRGWGYWTPPGIKPGAYRTSVARGPGGMRGEAPQIPGLLWSQDGPPSPPLGITPNMQLQELQPFLDSLAKGQSIFDRKPWRDDLRVWETKIKPEAIAEHRALQAVDLQRLSTQQLLHHLERCYANSHMAGALHGHFGAAFGTPLNHFLACCGHWTDCSARLLVDCVAGYSPPSVIGTNPPSVTMARAILNSPAAQQMLDACGSSDDAAAEHIIGLLQNDRVAGASVREWKDWVGNRLVDGHTGMATPPILIETPSTFIRLMKSCIQHVQNAEANRRLPEASPVLHVSEEAVRQVRAKIPQAHRAEFEELLADARACYKLRDERVNYADAWADGLTRKTVLEIGRRATESGKLSHQTLATEAGPEELSQLLDGSISSRSVRRMEADQQARHRCKIHLLPSQFSGPPLPPDMRYPPADTSGMDALKRWVSPAIANALDKLTRLNDVRAKLEEDIPAAPRGSQLHHGVGVSGSLYEGTAICGVMGIDVEVCDLCDGKIFVTCATSSPFNLVIPGIGGLVCDGGSLLAHPAITAREHGKPCIVGVGGICASVKTGDYLRIDPDAGTVEINPAPGSRAPGSRQSNANGSLGAPTATASAAGSQASAPYSMFSS